jgi:hypothetical protein
MADGIATFDLVCGTVFGGTASISLTGSVDSFVFSAPENLSTLWLTLPLALLFAVHGFREPKRISA